MLHKVSDFCDVVSLMYEKSMNLRRMKYDTPKDKQNKQEIDTLIVDIQALALQIAHDRSEYQK
jgi:hypothetical protein